MKIEIDLNDILADGDYGSETLQDSIKRQVIEKLKQEAAKNIGSKIDAEVAKFIKDEVNRVALEQTPDIANQLLDLEYKPVDTWGDAAKEKTTFRKQLLKSVKENMVYKKTSYSSDRNAFTKAVDEVLEENVKLFKAEFNKEVDGQFTRDALEYATNKLKEKLAIK